MEKNQLFLFVLSNITYLYNKHTCVFLEWLQLNFTM